jgi:hypothetical protein
MSVPATKHPKHNELVKVKALIEKAYDYLEKAHKIANKEKFTEFGGIRELEDGIEELMDTVIDMVTDIQNITQVD